MNNFLSNIIRFQFQYGSIKREQAKWEQHFIFSFQFQYGSIKRMEQLTTEQRTDEISIPIWFD